MIKDHRNKCTTFRRIFRNMCNFDTLISALGPSPCVTFFFLFRFYTRDKKHKLVNAPNVDNSYKWAGGGFLSNVTDLVRKFSSGGWDRHGDGSMGKGSEMLF